LRIGVLAKFALILFLLYPFILVIKYSIRDSLALGQSFTSVLSITWSYIFNNEGLLGYLNGLIFGLDQFFLASKYSQMQLSYFHSRIKFQHTLMRMQSIAFGMKEYMV
jgi:hypothetical protein